MATRSIPTVRFNLDKIKTNDTLTPIYLVFRYYKDGKAKRFSLYTGEKVKPIDWDYKRMRCKTSFKLSKDYIHTNKYLLKAEEATIDIWRETKGNIEPKDFKEEILFRTGKIEKKRNVTTLFQYLEKYLNDLKEKHGNRYNEFLKFQTTYFKLKEFATDRNIDLDFDTIDWKFKDDFEEWNYQEPRNYSANYAAKNLQRIKQILKKTYRLKLHQNQIFLDRDYTIEGANTKNKVRFSFEEIAKIEALDLTDNPRLDKVRDLFLVGCYTGLRVSDWYKIKKEQIKEKNGRKYIEINTKKISDKVVPIPITNALLKVLKKYKYALPSASSVEINRCLKDIIKLSLPNAKFQRIWNEGGENKSEYVEKWKFSTSHSARRSFCSNFLELGVDAEILRRITGHSDLKTFYAYCDINPMDRYLDRFFDIVEENEM